MNDFDSIQREILIEGLEDYVGLWQVARSVRRTFGELPTERIRELALHRLKPLLDGALIEAGVPAEGGSFACWGSDAATTLHRIDAEWRELGKDPNIPDICWFSNTEKGDLFVKTFYGP